jgi:hypothetical protein
MRRRKEGEEGGGKEGGGAEAEGGGGEEEEEEEEEEESDLKHINISVSKVVNRIWNSILVPHLLYLCISQHKETQGS